MKNRGNGKRTEAGKGNSSAEKTQAGQNSSSKKQARRRKKTVPKNRDHERNAAAKKYELNGGEDLGHLPMRDKPLSPERNINGRTESRLRRPGSGISKDLDARERKDALKKKKSTASEECNLRR